MIALAVLAALIATLAVCRDRRQPDVFILALQPLDDRSAIVIYQHRKHESVARVDDRGRTLWSSPLAGVPSTISPYNGIAVSADVVTVRYAHVRDSDPVDHAVAGFSLKDGALVWDTILTPYQPTSPPAGRHPETPPYTIALPVAEGLVAQWASDGSSAWLFAVDARTGRVVSRQPAADAASPDVLGTRVIVNEPGQTVVYDATGATPIWKLPAWFRGCAVADEYVTMTYETVEGDRKLVALRDGDPATRREIAVPPGHRSPQLHSCGRYRDRLVLLMKTDTHSKSGGRSQVWIVDSQGALLHAIDLGEDLMVETYWTRKIYPRAAPLAGELTRFAPYVHVRPDLRGAGESRLLMLDLEAGKIAWTAPTDAYQALFRADEHWYMFRPAPSPTLSVFDGRTGEFVAAVRIEGPGRIGDLAPYHVVSGRVWVYSDARGRASRPSIAVLDATSLAGAFQRGVHIEDVTSAVREQLGRVPGSGPAGSAPGP
ncbi:MAG: PQQ-binding-like beta-propeller repeat protein [Kofleriaceae bacterium]|nr:PQQ-binding-like beta-propeller repeat protein [Kofleriaceae bacterium]MCL4224227.1 PQQ-binding-like beta-propeller repeat protein [Myxococcales bacterium]